MNSANPAAPDLAGEGGPDDGPAEPRNLGELIDWLIDRRGYRSLSELARQTTIPYQTLWAWHKGSRNQKRPPSVEVLTKFAADLNLSETTVFRAAGRAFPVPTLGDADLAVLHLYHELDDSDRAVAEQMLRTLAERARSHGATRS